MEVNGNRNGFVTNIFQNISFCVLQKKNKNKVTSLERHEDE